MKAFNTLSDRTKQGIDALALIGGIVTLAGVMMLMAPDFLVDTLQKLLDPFTEVGGAEVTIGAIVSLVGIVGTAYYAYTQNMEFDGVNTVLVMTAAGFVVVFTVSPDFSAWVLESSTRGIIGGLVTTGLALAPFYR